MPRSAVPPNARVLHQGRYLRFVDEEGWEYVTRHSVTGIVVIVALTPARELVLVEQFRRPVHSGVIELPAGLVGDATGRQSESLATAAHRELTEETGYEAREMLELAAGPVAVGISDEVLTFFEARDLKKVGPGGGDETEAIIVHLVPLDDLEAFLAAKRAAGLAVDPKIYAGLYLVGAGPGAPR